MNRAPLAAAALVTLCALPAWADPDAPAVSIEGVRSFWYVVPSGGDVALSWHGWKLSAGAGVEDNHFGRDTATGDPLPESDPYTKPLVPDASLGLTYTWPLGFADLWTGGSAIGYGNLGAGSSDGAFPDQYGGTYGVFQAGLQRDRRSWNEHGLESGYAVSVEGDWSPRFLSVVYTDYHRVRFRSSAFFPLWDLEGASQQFSGLLALRGDASWTDGSQVPIPELRPTEVRGYDNTFDAKLLTVVTAELRARLPSWWGKHDVVPVGFGFIDAGQYSGFADSSAAADRAGVLLGAGIGGGLELFGKVTPTLTLGVPLAGVQPRLWYDLSFQLAF